MLFCVPNPDDLLTGPANGFAAAQLFYDVFYARFHSGFGGMLLLLVPASAMLLCLLVCMMAGSRMIFSFARNGGVPFSSYFGRVHAQLRTPLRAVWLLAGASALFGLPQLFSTVVFNAVVSITCVGLLISYAIPIACRRTISRSTFVPGPFNLGKYSAVVGWGAVAWISLASVCFCLPTAYPVASNTFNYSSVAVGIVFVGTVGSWVFPKWGARQWFLGPKLPPKLLNTWLSRKDAMTARRSPVRV
ncbi:hypothetical protein WJX73_003753 [Symbiochloris irregularis]